jgi:hypothetical protein
MRRVLLLLLLSGAAALIAITLRQRATPVAATAPPTWPPIAPRPEPATTPATAPAADVVEPPTVVDTETSWRPLNADGTMPDGYPIKAKNQSMIFHVPTGRFYARTIPERCYATEAAAIADGYRRAKA